MDCSPPGSSVHGILQARVLEWVAMPSSGGSSRPRDWTCGSCTLDGFLHSRQMLHHSRQGNPPLCLTFFFPWPPACEAPVLSSTPSLATPLVFGPAPSQALRSPRGKDRGRRGWDVGWHPGLVRRLGACAYHPCVTGCMYARRRTLGFSLPASCFHPVLRDGGPPEPSLQSLRAGPAGRSREDKRFPAKMGVTSLDTDMYIHVCLSACNCFSFFFLQS